jgi:hypothetical protein
MSDAGERDAPDEATAAWRTFSRALRRPTQPTAIADGLPDRRRLEQELASAELALVWLRALAGAGRDRLANEALPEARGKPIAPTAPTGAARTRARRRAGAKGYRRRGGAGDRLPSKGSR